MKFNLALDTKGNIGVLLSAVYAFSASGEFTWSGTTGDTVISIVLDGATSLTTTQWAVVNANPYTLTFVNPGP